MRTQKCKICGRRLNIESDELSGDCGGDCWGCIGEIEAGGGFKPSIRIVRDEWRRGLRPNWTPPNLPETIATWMSIDAAEFPRFAALNWRSIPFQARDQLIFLNKDLATKMAQNLYAPRGGGWVLELQVERSLCEENGLDEDNAHEYRPIPIGPADVARWNEALVGEIRVIAEFR